MRRLLLHYYLATPAFLVLDYAAGLNVRTVFLDGSALRLVYYAAAFACGLVAWRRPAIGPMVGMVESGTNAALVIVGMFLRVWAAGEAALSTDAAAGPGLTPEVVVNGALSGGMFLWSFYANQAAAIAQRGARGWPPDGTHR